MYYENEIQTRGHGPAGRGRGNLRMKTKEQTEYLCKYSEGYRFIVFDPDGGRTYAKSLIQAFRIAKGMPPGTVVNEMRVRFEFVTEGSA